MRIRGMFGAVMLPAISIVLGAGCNAIVGVRDVEPPVTDANGTAGDDGGGPPTDPAVDAGAPDTGVDGEDASVDTGPDVFDAGFCLPSAANLVSWWTGDGAFTDEQAQNPGTEVGAVPFVAAKVGQGFQFDAAAPNYVEVPDSASLDITTAITIEAWINVGKAGLRGRIVNKATVNMGDGYLLDVLDGRLRLIAGDVLHILTAPADLPVGGLVHVAGTYDGVNMKLFVAGAEVASIAATGAIPTNSLPLRIGVDSSEGSRFEGVVDEVGIYSRALTLAEIASIDAAGAFGRCK